MTSQHTPGPWTNWDGNIGHGELSIAFMASWSAKHQVEHEANARLIAAAPDGYELAIAFLAYLRDDSRSERRRQECIAGCVAFLAKARGEG